jgi:hypothetical protein
MAAIEDPVQCTAMIIRMAVQCQDIVRRASDERDVGNRERPREVTQQYLARKVESLVENGRCAAAMRPCTQLADMIERGLDREDVAAPLSLEQQRQVVADLFPRASLEDLNLPAIPADTPCLEAITAEDVKLVLTRLPAGSASGVSGWTYGILREMAFQPLDRGVPFCTSLAGFFNKLAVGAIDRRLWTPIRNVMIPQPDKPKPRPLGIGDAIIRVFTRCALNQQGVTIGRKLMPLQFGIGVSGGSEMMARMAQVSLDSHEGQVLVSLDMKNAFNNISNVAMQKGVQEYAPSLLRIFQWMYGQPTDIVSISGDLLGTREKGCSQGEPLASAFFSMGVHPTVKKVSQAVEAISSTRLQPKSGAVMAFMDDINYTCHVTRLDQCINRVEAILGEDGFQLAVSKCKIVDISPQQRRTPLTRSPVLPYEVRRDGIKVLGAPAGTPQFRQQLIEEKKEKMVKPLKALSRLRVEIGFKILKSCVNARFSYLARVTDPIENTNACKSFDEDVDAAFLQLLGVNSVGGGSQAEASLPPATPPSTSAGQPTPAELNRIPLGAATTALILRGLPTALGGFGMVRYAGIVAERAAVKSRALVKALVDDFYSEVGSATYLLPGLWKPDESCIHVGGGSTYFEFIHLPALTGISESLVDGEGSPDSAVQAGGDHTDGRDITRPRDTPLDQIHNICQIFYTKVVKAILQHLRTSGQMGSAAWLGSQQFRGSGCWINRRIRGYYNQLRGDSYRMAMRHRALIPFMFGREAPPLCTCARSIPSDNDLCYHLLHCPHSQFFVTQRHDHIVRIISDALSDIAEVSSRISEVATEVRMAAPPPDTALYTADIVVRIDGILYAVDITVANPTAEKYLTRGSVVDTNISTAIRAEEKKTLYRKIRAEPQFVAFAVDATGRLGRDARQFLDSILQGEHLDMKRTILDQVHVICVLHNAKNLVSRAGEQHFRSYHSPVGGEEEEET